MGIYVLFRTGCTTIYVSEMWFEIFDWFDYLKNVYVYNVYFIV